MFSSKTINALVLLQLAATSCHLVGAIAAQHRQARHTSPSPEPTSEPTLTSTDTGASISVDLFSVGDGSSEDRSTGTANGTSEYVLNANNVWIAASSPPIADGTSPPEMRKDDVITTDAAVIGSLAIDRSDMEGVSAEAKSRSTKAPIYALRHGRGIFAISGGTGCYKGARGQAQANFGIQSSRVDLFVPSISWIFDDTDDTGIGPQDTTWEEEGGNGRRLGPDGEGTEEDANSHHFDRRLQSDQECSPFREGVDSFNIMSLNLERRSNPPDNKHVKDSSASYHEHGEFQSQEQWFEGISGEYSLSCVHHECKLFFYFGIGPSTNDFFSTTRERRNLLNDEGGKDGNDRMMTSLNLQGTTELAFQGPDVDMLVCIENCQVGDSTYNAKIEVDAEHYESINLRNFDNTDRLVQLDSHGKGSSAKGTKAPKASKGTIFVNTNECLVLSQACSDSGKGKGKGGSKGTIGCTDAGKGKGKGGSKGSKGSHGPSAYENAPDGTVCTGGTCLGGVCVAAATAPAAGAAAALLLPQNSPPLPTDDLFSFVGGQNSDVVYTDEVLLNDIDPDGDTLNVVAVNQDNNSVGMAIILPSGASLTVEADGSFLYDPENYFNYLHTGETATETFEYTVSDGQRNTDVATVTIVIEGNNDPPMAADDTETTTEDMTVSSSVLLNDSDPESDTIRLIVDTMNGSTNNVGQEITLPSGAKVFLTSDGLYTFDPNGQYESLNDSDTALVTFEYTITDGFGGTAGATATIVITGVNDPPVAENDDLGPVPAGLPVTYNLLTNDVNPEQNGLVVTEVEGQSVSSSGSTTINLSSGALLTINGSTGEMMVDPNGQFDSLNGSQTATITFEYVIADGNGVTDSAIATLTLVGRDTSSPSAGPSVAPSAAPSAGPSVAPSAAPTDVFVCPVQTVNGATEGTISGSSVNGGTTTQTLQFDLFASAFTSNGKACINGLIGVQPPYNILFVIDISGSTGNSFPGTEVGDVNGDGLFNTVLDAEIESIIKAIEAIIATPSLTNDNVNIGIVTFSTTASYVGNWPPADEINPDAINPDLETTLKSLRDGGWTNFDDALDKAITYFQDHAPDVNSRTNKMYFLSDGLPNRCGDGDANTDETGCSNGDNNPGVTVFTSELEALGQYSVENYAIGVGTGSNISDGSGLDKIDNTENPNTGDTAVQVTTTDELASVIVENPVYAEVLDFTVEINGAVVPGVDETSLVEGISGYVLEVNEISGLDATNGASNTITATILLDVDGDSATLNDQLQLSTSVDVIGTAGASF